jgi:hypothetical protein
MLGSFEWRPVEKMSAEGKSGLLRMNGPTDVLEWNAWYRGAISFAPSARSNPTTFQAVRFQPPDPDENREGWRNTGKARTLYSISSTS